MRQILCVAMALLMLAHLIPAALGADSIATQIKGMPAGTAIELRLKTKQKMKGTRGAVANSGFTFVDAGAAEHQIAFDEVASVKPLTGKSHVMRNVLIGVGIGVAALGITLGILLRCGPFGCGNRVRI